MKHILKLWESTSNLIKIIIGIAALALFLPKISGVYNNYEDSKKESTTSTYGKYGILYLDERHWLSGENVICLKKFENYCQEVKEQCTEFFDSENLNNNYNEFNSCIEKIRVNYELPSGGAFKFDMYSRPSEKLKPIFSSPVDPYKDEKQWLTEDSTCQSLEDEKDIKYCLEIKEACSKFIPSSFLPINNKAFSTCVAEVRERLGMPPIVETDIFDNTQTVEGDTKINWGNFINSPFTNFETIEKRWGTMSSEQKLQTVRNVFQTGTTYDQFPDWMKNDPVIVEIKEELQQINSDN